MSLRPEVVDRVHSERDGQAAQSAKPKLTWITGSPYWSVAGLQAVLYFPVGQCTVPASQSTAKSVKAKPWPAAACQL